MDNGSRPQHGKNLGWKVLAGYVVIFAVVTISYTVWTVGIRFVSLWLGIPQCTSVTLNRLGGIAISIGASAAASQLILRRCFGSLAFQRHPGWWSDLLFGAFLSTIAMMTLFTIFKGSGWLITQSWRWKTVSSGTWAGILWYSILINAYAAVGEEVIFRGYLLSGLKEAWGKTISMAMMCVIFAAMHLMVGTAEQTPFPLFILSLVGPGLLLGWGYLRTGSLWLPIGLHFMWNLVQDDLLNLPGRAGLDSLFGLHNQLHGPSWLVGSAFGIETGLLSLVPLGICFGGVWLWTRKRKSNRHAKDIRLHEKDDRI